MKVWFVNCLRQHYSDMKKILSVLFAVFISVSAFAQEPLDVLSSVDESLYKQIFDLQDKEKVVAAQKLEHQITDPILMNEVLYQRYTYKQYHTRGAEVKEWMDKYYDMPGATRMEKLAKRKQASVRSPKIPAMITGRASSIDVAQSDGLSTKTYSGATEKTVNKFKKAIRGGHTKIARLILEDKAFKGKITSTDYGRLAGRLSYSYYTDGEYELARKWGSVGAETESEYGLWTLGLLSFKQEKYGESRDYFARILKIDKISTIRKVETAFWAGRAADLNEDKEEAREFWKIAAEYPMAFYGALAATMLGDVPEYEFFEQELTSEDIDALRTDRYGKAALALLQIKRKDRAAEYLKYMITSKISDKNLHAVNSVATAYGLPRVAILASGVIKDRGILEIDDDVIYSAQYPLPDWEPMGGWSIDRALLLAITKQESGFRSDVTSKAGANGLMQIMPGTARMVARANKVNMSDLDITNPEHNMFLGQQFIVDLLMHPNINNNIIKMLVAYNAGMGNLIKFQKSFSTDDPLLFIESFPIYETRSYIKRVMANLWLYRARLNQPLTTLKVLADSGWPLYNSEDEYVRNKQNERVL